MLQILLDMYTGHIIYTRYNTYKFKIKKRSLFHGMKKNLKYQRNTQKCFRYKNQAFGKQMNK